jgi:flap endonuclease-1
MGVPYIVAVEEADSEIAKLCENGYVDIVSSDDMDILTFGSPKIVRNLFSTRLPINEINQKELLNKLNLTYEQFVELCILFGSDYNEHIKNIKTNDIYNIYIKNKSLDLCNK